MSYRKAEEKGKNGKKTQKKRLSRKRKREIWVQSAAILTVAGVMMILAGVDVDMSRSGCQTGQQQEKPLRSAAAENTETIQGNGGTSDQKETVSEIPEQKEKGIGDEGGEAEDMVQAALQDSEDWSLILVNAWNPIPEDYQVELEELDNGQAVDRRCYPMLQQMMDDCRAAGLEPEICSSWRSFERQKELNKNKAERLIGEGCPEEQAVQEAAKTVAAPGNSEHQTGLALDIVDSGYPELETAQEDTPVQRWLMENSWKYGFVLRYPQGKSGVTGIIYEPWHYRYVGVQAAEEMYRDNLCLEEYLAFQPEK